MRLQNVTQSPQILLLYICIRCGTLLTIAPPPLKNV